jgi:hypothetical protein
MFYLTTNVAAERVAVYLNQRHQAMPLQPDTRPLLIA